MDSNLELIPTLALMTLAAVLLVGVALFARFMRKRSNRHPLAGERGHQIEEARARQNAQPLTDAPPTRR